MLGLSCSAGVSLVGESRAYSLVAVRGLLIAVTSLFGEHRLQGTRASVVATLRLLSMGSVVAVHGLSLHVQSSQTRDGTCVHQVLY